ncbi:DAK2 domain-containing protein [Jannaschia sp. R86511]|uniref:DAK2 domain-containing protein n=1 Tax=Jannaschia sp. R86511 TaxID=3093853 RepID=UPI0036D310CB
MTGEASTREPGDDAPLPLPALDGPALRRWVDLVARRLAGARAELDALNVFPVPDGDTGTNLHLTVRGALDEGGDDLARALLVHARGSSGVIASQLVRGWSDVLTVRGRDPLGGVDGAGLAKALRRGDDLAWAAVGEPVEGTVLSVSRAAAAAAERAVADGAALPDVVDAVVDAAEAALDRTPGQLPALAAAGVVDAGGAGLVLALRALRDVVGSTGGAGGPARAPWADVEGGSERSGSDLSGADRSGGGDLASRGVAGTDLDPDGPGYEVMYLLAVPPAAVAPAVAKGAEPAEGAAGAAGVAGAGPGERLRERLQGLGDSVVVVGGDGLWHAHVHTDDPGGAVEAGLALGTPRAIRITHFAAAREAAGRGEDRHVDRPSDRPAQAQPDRPADPATAALAVVACAGGHATAEVCRQAGASVVPSAPGERASTGQVLREVLEAGRRTRRVLVLPNDAETAAVAHQAALAAQEQGVTAVVARSRSQVQVLAALAVVGAGAANDAAAVVALESVEAAVAGCRHGAVAVAARDCSTLVGPCRRGDLVGTVGREVVAVGRDEVEVTAAVVAALGAATAELVSVLPGQDAAPGLVDRLLADLRARFPGPQVDVVAGGQPRYLLLLGCE